MRIVPEQNTEYLFFVVPLMSSIYWRVTQIENTLSTDA